MAETFFFSDNYENSSIYKKERKCNDQYKCYECDGYGIIQIGSYEGDYTENCRNCRGTGELYTTITLREYETLKIIAQNN